MQRLWQIEYRYVIFISIISIISISITIRGILIDEKLLKPRKKIGDVKSQCFVFIVYRNHL